MPHHAIASVVRPVSFAYGVNSQGFPNFPGWLGKNSTATRISRSAVELQARMRLVTSGSRFAIRETYVPYLFKSLSDPLIKNGAVSMTLIFEGVSIECMRIEIWRRRRRLNFCFFYSSQQDGIQQVVDVMDDYYLGTEDRDTIMELGINPSGEQVLKKIPSAVKSGFTRKYNAANQWVETF